MKKFLMGAAALLVAGPALASGFLTNGLPTVGPSTVNGVPQSFPNGVTTQPGTSMLLPMDTQYPNGLNPQSVAVTPFQLAAFSSELIANQATSTAGAATLNTRGGMVTTEALTTAIGSTYTFVLTNSQILAGSTPQVAFYSKSNTGGAATITSVTAAAGSMTVVVTNSGTAAYNGTMLLVFHI